jgi:hypothetical protein
MKDCDDNTTVVGMTGKSEAIRTGLDRRFTEMIGKYSDSFIYVNTDYRDLIS